MSFNRQKTSVLIVDDDEPFRKLVKKQVTKEGFRFQEASNVEEAFNHLIMKPIDLIILESRLANKPDSRALPELKRSYPKAALVVTTDATDVNKVIDCLKSGVHDYLPESFGSEELNLCIDNAIKKKGLESDLRQYQGIVTPTVKNPKNFIRKSTLHSFERLVTELEVKDRYMAGHSRRVSGMALELGQLLGLDSIQLEELRWGGLLHDVGMIAVDTTISNKPGKLTNEEYRHLMLHAVLGPEMVKTVANDVILSIVRHHHDHYDGKGFEQELAGNDIPLGARIVAIADAFDAMTNERPYRNALSIEKTLAELQRSKGSQFDPSFVDVFLKMQTRYLLIT